MIDQIPAGSTFVDAVVNNPDSTREFCAPPNLCYLGTLRGGSVATVHLTLRVDDVFEGSELTNAAAVTGDQPDSRPANNVDDATVIVFDSPIGSGDTPDAPSVPEEPTAITLINFMALPDIDSDTQRIVLRWTTGSELNTWGFHLLRGTSTDRNQAMLITPNTIVSKLGSDTGYPAAASYEFVDSTIETGVLYYYWLAEVEVDGNTEEFGPVSAQIGYGVRGEAQRGILYLPIINR